MSLTPAEEARIVMAAAGAILPVGGALGTAPFAQTFDRRFALSTVFAPTSGTITMTGIWLPAGSVVTGITFVSGSTPESGGSHLWYALYKGNAPLGATSYSLMAQCTDVTGAAAFGANTALREALTTPQVCPYSGLYLIGFCCVGTVPTLLNITAATVNANGNITGMTPIVASTADAGLTNAAAATLGAQTAITQSLYAFVD
jgi:hypothetical protein